MIEAKRVGELCAEVANNIPAEAVELLGSEDAETVARTLETLNPIQAVAVLWQMTEDRRQAVLDAATPEWARQWGRNHDYDEESVGRMMAPAFAVVPPTLTIAEAIERLREAVKKTLVSYIFVVDGSNKLLGVLVFRDMLLAPPNQHVSDVMIGNPFFLSASLSIIDAMRAMLTRHHPSYPVCDDAGHLVGVMRGETVFQQQAFELSAQAGSMVGIQKEERLATPWSRSLRMRHPWLQLNLATAFVAAAVVGVFEATIDRVVALAIFLPVLAGQSGNTGMQALAVTLRGMTLGETERMRIDALVLKEAWLGLINGALVGFTAGVGMFIYAYLQHLPAATTLALVVAVAMTGSCVASGVSGVIVPVVLRRLGADPATASSIFLTTTTDCMSMGALLALATWLVP